MTNIIIRFCKKYPIWGVKVIDLIHFCKIAELMNNKAHLTQKELDKICLIKAVMNKVRL